MAHIEKCFIYKTTIQCGTPGIKKFLKLSKKEQEPYFSSKPSSKWMYNGLKFYCLFLYYNPD